MGKILITALLVSLSSMVFAAKPNKSNCGKKRMEVSCAQVQGAKREFFCAKKAPSEELKSKRCLQEIKHKKNAKKKKAIKKNNKK